MNKVFHHTIISIKIFLLSFFYFISFQDLFSQINIPNTTPLTENFNGMGTTTTLPANWRIRASSAAPTWATGVTTVTQTAQTGTPTTGGTYNWGSNNSNTERALGAMTSGSFASPNNIMAWYRNTNASNLTELSISYDLERYRINTASASVQFYYSTDGTNWTAVAAGDISAATISTGASAYTFPAPVVFNSATNPFTITGLNIPTNGDIYLRWNLNTTGSNSQGIGIDNVVVTASFIACTPVSAPSTNASGIAFNSVGCNSMNISWTNGNGSNRIVVAKQNTAITGAPTDNVAYVANTVFGLGNTISANEYVVYNGNGNSVTITNLSATTTYHFSIFEYNGDPGCQAYQTTGELIGSQITATCAICPQMTGALINACNGSCNEGDNEILFFNSGDFSIPVAPANIIVRYENVNPATVNYTESFTTNPGAINAFNTSAGCGTLFYDASVIGTIPPNSVFMIMRSSTCYGFDFSAFCGLSAVYVLFSTDASWVVGGNFVNGGAAGVLRYFRTDFSAVASGCVIDYNYEPFLLSGGGDGDAVSWGTNGGAAIQYFNNGCNPPLTVLPVEIIHFTAIRDANKTFIKWISASENNIQFYSLEKSSDGIHFTNLAKINAAGNSNSEIQYEVLDDEANEGTIYYRLSYTDYNGDLKIHQTITIENPDSFTFKVFPNPAHEFITISSAESISLSSIEIINQIGVLVKTENIIIKDFPAKVFIQELPDGFYYVIVRSDNSFYSASFIKN